MRRWSPTVAAALLVVGVAGGVQADVIHGETSQDTFGFDADGRVVDDLSVDRIFVEGWNLFARTGQGARILGRLDQSDDFRITIEVVPPDELEDGDELWGLSVMDEAPENGPRVVTIYLVDVDRTPEGLAETLFHEMRHVELWLDGDFRSSSSGEGGHNDLHDRVDTDFIQFLAQLEEAKPQPPAEPSTPIYDSLVARVQDEEALVAVAKDLGFALDLGLGTENTLVRQAVEIDEYFADVEIDPETQALIQAALAGLADVEGCATTPDITVCGVRVAPVALPDDVLVGIEIGGVLDPDALDGSVSIFAGFESDGDPSNDLSPLGPLDPYQGVDRWYEMILDGGAWDMNVWQVGPDGSTPGLDSGSGAVGAVQGDSAWFRIPRSELPGGDPRFRVAMVGFEQDPITGITSVDVSGELPSDPLIGLDGSRAGGPVTGSAAVGGGVVLSHGPATVPAGGVLDTEFCLFAPDGAPRVGQEVFTTLGEPPDAADATHNSSVTDDEGCARMGLAVEVEAGITGLRFSFGSEVVRVGSVEVIGRPNRPVSSGSSTGDGYGAFSVFFGQLFASLADGEEGDGSVHHSEDEPGDQVNPFFGSPLDQEDTTLPLGWDILWGDSWVMDSVDDPTLDPTVVKVGPAGGTAQPSGYTFYSRYTMAAGVEDREPLGTHWCSVSVHARLPDRPTTLPASVIDDQDPAADTNVSWTAWFGPEGQMATAKTEVNPETRVPQTVEDHATVAAVQGSDITLMIPADEIVDAERIVMSASCMPLEFTDYRLHTRDILVDTDVSPGYFDPAFVVGAAGEPTGEDSEGGFDEPEQPSVARQPVRLAQPPVVRWDPFAEDPSDGGVPTVVSLLAMALGLGAVAGGVVAFRREGSR